ncbi:MAG: hypothetical protein Aurels2KO_42350 [Aureliella sp.]
MSKSFKGTTASGGLKLLYVVAAASTVIMLAVVLWPTDQSTPPTEDSVGQAAPPTAPASGTRAPEEASSSTASPTDSTQSVAPKPSDPFNTQIEQERLIADLEKAIADFPSDAKLKHLGAVTYAEVLQTERALELFEQSLSIDDSNAEVFVAYADLLLQVGRADDAVERLEKSRSQIEKLASQTTSGQPTSSRTTFALALSKAYAQTGQLEKALAELETLQPEPQYLSQVKVELAQVQNQLQKFELAETNARIAVEEGTQDRAAYLALSTALMRQGKREEAVEIRKQMPEIEQQVAPGDQAYQQSFRKFAAHTYAVLASGFEAKGLLGEAQERLQYSLALDANSESALRTMVNLQRSQGRLDQAVAWQERLVASEPENLIYVVNLASLAVANRDAALAEKALRRAVELDETGMADLQLARFLMEFGKHAEAVEAARSGVLQLGSIDAHVLLIATLQRQGNRVAAAQAYVEAKRLFPNAPQLAGFQP